MNVKHDCRLSVTVVYQNLQLNGYFGYSELCGEPDGGVSDGGEPDGVERRHSSAPAGASTCRAASASPCAGRSVDSPEVPMDVAVPDTQKELLQSLIHSRRFRE